MVDTKTKAVIVLAIIVCSTLTKHDVEGASVLGIMIPMVTDLINSLIKNFPELKPLLLKIKPIAGDLQEALDKLVKLLKKLGLGKNN